MSFHRERWALGLLAASTLHCQSITSGSLRGRVVRRDSGQPIQGAVLILRNSQIGWSQRTTSSAEGHFQFLGVPVGICDISVLAPGIQGRRLRGLAISLGATPALDLALEEAVPSDVVEVVGSASSSDLQLVSPTSRITQEILEVLPSHLRNLNELLLMSSGAVAPSPGLVSVDGARSTQNQLLVDGMSVTSTYSGYPLGVLSSSFLFSLGTIQEVQVLNHSFDVQYGEATGGVVNALTRSGSNTFRGQVLLQGRPGSWMAAMQPVASDPTGIVNRPASLERHADARTFNLVWSGPLVPDRAHFLVGMERQSRRDQIQAVPMILDYPGYRDADFEAWKAALGNRLELDASGRRWSDDLATPYGVDQLSHSALLKLDIRPDPDLSITIRWNATRWQGLWGSPTLAMLRSNALDRDDTTHQVLAEVQSLIGGHVLHEFRVQWSRERYQALPLEGWTPELVVANLHAGGNSYATKAYRESMVQVSDVWHGSLGRFQWKVGLDGKRLQALDDQLPFQNAGFYFPDYRTAVRWSQGTLEPGKGLQYSQSLRLQGGSDRLVQWLGAAYLQLQVQDLGLRGLDLQFGLRHSWQTWDRSALSNPMLAGLDSPTSGQSLDPRLSVSWRLPQRPQWTLRAGLGRFSGPGLGVLGMKVRTWNGMASRFLDAFVMGDDPWLSANGLLSQERRIRGNHLLALTPAELMAALDQRGGQTLALWDPAGAPTQAWKTALGLEWSGPEGMAARFQALCSRTRNLPHWINVNLRPCDEYGRPIPGSGYQDGYPVGINRFSRLQEDRPGMAIIGGRQLSFGTAGDVYLSTRMGRALHRSLAFDLRRESNRGFGGFLSVTWSHTKDHNTHEPQAEILPRSVVMNPARLDDSWADSDYDVRWRGQLTAAYTHPAGFRGTLSGRWATGRPITARDAEDLNGDGLYSDPAPGFGGRNGYRLPSVRSLDLRLSQRLPECVTHLRLEFLLEVANVFNWANVRGINPVATALGQPVTGLGQSTLPDRATRSVTLGLQASW